jgi:hypothetical protein
MLANPFPDCVFYTYFGPTSFPFADTCILYSTCKNLESCTDCKTEDIFCIFCSAPVEGGLGENLVGVLDDTAEESVCEASCLSEDACSFYTYHLPNATAFPKTCFLLSSLEEPIRACDDGTCSTGSSSCESTFCGIIDFNGALHQSPGLMVNQTQDVAVVSIGPCLQSLLVLAVGGGGSGKEGDCGSGGGSGHIATTDLRSRSGYDLYRGAIHQ